MKPFKGREFTPDEDVQDVYGPPPEDAEPVLETEVMQCVYGPPSMMNGGTEPVLRGDTSADAEVTEEFGLLLGCCRSIRERTDFKPKVAIVLGSGLGDFAETSVDIECAIDYHDIKGLPFSTVQGHRGRFVFGYIGDVPVVVMQGRVHYYEGNTSAAAVRGVRLMSMLGAEVLFLTNAAGGIDPSFHAGDFMLIEDHISSFIPNPLIGRNIDQIGTRFPDMSCVYDMQLRSIIGSTAQELGIGLRHGVYVQLSGPSFETPAEIRMLRGLGGNAVGMSSVIEAIAARHAGMRVCGISCISNLASGMTDQPLSHAEVQESADKAAPKFRELVSRSIVKIGGTL